MLRSQPFLNTIASEAAFNQTKLSQTLLKEFSKNLKLPEQIILRLNDLIVYSSLDLSGPKREFLTGLFRIAIKRRYYIKCMRDYLPLFKGMKGNILDTHFPGGLSQPYLYSDKLEEDPFCGQSGGARGADEEEEKTNEVEKGLTQD